MNRRALVTGAAKRVGRAIAIELAKHDWDLILHYNTSREEVEDAATACRKKNVNVTVIQADLMKARSCIDLVGAVTSRWDRIDLVVHNASMFYPKRFEQITIQEYDAMHALHSRAPFFVTQGLLRALRASRDGTVIHICDIGADRPVPGYAHYSASKASLVMLVKAMAVELGPELRVLGISPGQVAWPPDYTEELRARLSHKIPLQRVGEPEDIAQAALWLASDASSFVTGQALVVDGGVMRKA